MENNTLQHTANHGVDGSPIADIMQRITDVWVRVN